MAGLFVVAARFVEAIVTYTRIAWWGIVAPRVGRGRALTVLQGVITGPQGVLLSVRSDLWGWELPGGTPERGETGEETLRREVFEETGLEVEILRHVGDYIRTGFRPHTARVYLCRWVRGVPRVSSETRAVRWFQPGQLPDTLFPWYRGPLADAFEGGTEPLTRRERQGVGAIWAGMKIDLRMRMSRDA